MNYNLSLLQPIFGLLIGVLFIIFSSKVAFYLQKVFEKLPKYDQNMYRDLSVRPVYIKIIGVVYIFIAIRGIIARFTNA